MGYKDLVVYRLATTIYDATVVFCSKFIDQRSRTVDQMVQAARSGKQNIVEGSLEKSEESNIKLTSVARASFGELLEDYFDFLRQKGFILWDKNDPRVLKIRLFRETTANSTNLTNLANWTNLNLNKGEDFANLLVCLIYKENYLLDQLLRAQRDNFIKNGGFRENLFKDRREFLRNKN
ncbi:MAG: four helix bundle suffix domain-containing protein [bacterium]|nr:four helix bundle suffix domain-containing protein [bacterium]